MPEAVCLTHVSTLPPPKREGWGRKAYLTIADEMMLVMYLLSARDGTLRRTFE